jgi:hypothetical protein
MTTQLLLASPGTPVVFAAAGLGDVLWTPASTALAHGRLSAVWDRGVGHLPVRYRWLASVRWVATPAANDRWSLWFVTADAAADPAQTDGALTLGDADLSTENELLANASPFGTILATANDKLFLSSGVIDLFSRYLAIAGWNGSSTKALTATPGDFFLRLEPIPPVIEAPV